jgi:hypothetical protein
MGSALLSGIGKIAIAGELAGSSVNQLINLLAAGVGVETILKLIGLRVETAASPRAVQATSSGIESSESNRPSTTFLRVERNR